MERMASTRGEVKQVRGTAYMVSAYSINLDYILAEGQSLVDYELEEIMRGRFPSQQFELLVHCATPRE
jgi:hypothetical protein